MRGDECDFEKRRLSVKKSLKKHETFTARFWVAIRGGGHRTYTRILGKVVQMLQRSMGNPCKSCPIRQQGNNIRENLCWRHRSSVPATLILMLFIYFHSAKQVTNYRTKHGTSQLFQTYPILTCHSNSTFVVMVSNSCRCSRRELQIFHAQLDLRLVLSSVFRIWRMAFGPDTSVTTRLRYPGKKTKQ